MTMTLLPSLLLNNQPTWGNVLLIAIPALAAYVFLKVYGYLSSPIMQVKFVPGWPFIKHIPHLFGARDERTLQVSRVEFAGEEGLYRCLDYDGKFDIGVCKPEYVKHVLITCSKKYRRPTFFKRRMLDAIGGLFLAEGADHAWQKKLINPMFTTAGVKRYIDAFTRHCADITSLWTQKCYNASSSKAAILVENDIKHLTLDIIGDTAFGCIFDTVLSEGTDASKSFTTTILNGMDPIRVPLLNFIPYFNEIPTWNNVVVNRARKIANEIVKKVIKERRNSTQENVDLLSVLIGATDDETGKAMSNSSLVSNVWTFMIEGNETIASGLTWIVYHLAMHPEIQARARKEAQDILHEYGQFDSESVDKLLYMTAVVKETLRITPPVILDFRQCVEDDCIGNLTIPKGTVVIIPILGIHCHKKFWPEPEKFIPERFLESDPNWSSGVHGQTYMPFGNGPRMCIGYKFALMQMKVVIALLLTKFRFSIDPNHPEVGNVSLFSLRCTPSPKLYVECING